ncbi:MAG: hypothetical protein AB1486_26525 [Planctomycetota bacterium]
MTTRHKRCGVTPARGVRWLLGPVAIVAGVLSLGRMMVSPPEAMGAVRPPTDSDHDLLADALEQQLLLNPANPDTDGDGLPDGFEYMLYSDPRDRDDVAAIAPSFRMTPTLEGENLKITLFFLPGSEDLLKAFKFFLFTPAMERDGGRVSNGADITRLLPRGIQEVGYAVHDGFLATSYAFSIPLKPLQPLMPVSLGAAANIAGVPAADVIYVDIIEGVPITVHGLGVPGLQSGLFSDSLPWDPLVDELPDGWGDQQVCETRQEAIDSRDGIVVYEIVEAECKPTINRFCFSDCAAQVGATVTTLDYGFLIGLVTDF